MPQLQEMRKQQLREICGEDSAKMRSIEDMSNNEFNNLIVDDSHGIIYCYIPKVIQI